MATDSKKRIIICPICHKKLKIEVDEIEIPEHNHAELTRIKCSASGYPIPD
jgi:C4-type Zn-finger protein